MNQEQRKTLEKLMEKLSELRSEAEELHDYVRGTWETASAEEEETLGSELVSLEDAINWLDHAADTFEAGFSADPLP